MKVRCRPAAGPTGCSATTTGRASRSRVGPAQARVAAILLLTLRGTPTLYNGDELGMPMAHIPPDRVLDPFEMNVPGLGLGRDGARSPMPWSEAAYAGFSRSEPWCPLIEDWKTTNVSLLENDPASMLTLHRKLLALRKQYPALTTGSYHALLATGDILVYRRTQGSMSILVALIWDPVRDRSMWSNAEGEPWSPAIATGPMKFAREGLTWAVSRRVV